MGWIPHTVITVGCVYGPFVLVHSPGVLAHTPSGKQCAATGKDNNLSLHHMWGGHPMGDRIVVVQYSGHQHANRAEAAAVRSVPQEGDD